MFKPVSPKVDFPSLERKILEFWKEDKIFEKSLKNRQGQKKFVFYDGPPFATGLPHYGHILAMAIKDAVTRYKAMKGFYVPRRLGWDCHGLPVEYEVEKELKISGKKQIEEMGVEKFCESCRNIVFRYTREWEKTIERMGRWADLENTYATLNLPYMESIWWVFKQVWDKGLVYRGFKSMPYCPRCGTPLSNFETNQGYRDNVPDPSVYVKFELADEPGTYFLVWTTTPWTLPGNAALAFHPEVKYVKVKTENGQNLILAEKRLSVLSGEKKVVKEIAVKDLVGKNYKPLYTFIEREKGKKSYLVMAADFVNTEEGTGIVHIAPAFGEDDLNLGVKENLQIIQTVDENGKFIDPVEPWAGKFVKDADLGIIKDLKERGLLYRAETIKHTYPFCWRCETPLIYYAVSTWFIKVSQLREELVRNNQKIHWMPEHIKEGRFGKWLEEARDWAISRNRFWGAPLPVWYCDKCKRYTAIGSLTELEEKSLNAGEITDLHRPFIDEIKIRCNCGFTATRVPEVLDCWFESGSMPYAQDHYPFEQKEEFEKSFPADFIAEGLDQTRGWFYTLHVLATILFDNPAFKNCIVNGIILDKEGKKLSKRLRNYPEPETIFEKYGADSMRFLLLSSPASLAEDLRISEAIVSDVTRRVILILWNVCNFFTTYAAVDGWRRPEKTAELKSGHILDRWILSRLNSLIKKVTEEADDYNLPKALNPQADFIINDLSTWYVRRCRDRVGPTVESKEDKENFYATAYYVLVTLAKMLAPFLPFVSEEIYKNLTGEESVHLSEWPKFNNDAIDTILEEEMKGVRKICELGHSLRKKAGLKVRQPLNDLFYSFGRKIETYEPLKWADLIKEELNIKTVLYGESHHMPAHEGKWESAVLPVAPGDVSVSIRTDLSPLLVKEGEARGIIRQIQELRKQAACELDEKITVYVPSWPKECEDYILKQTLSDKIIPSKKLEIERHD